MDVRSTKSHFTGDMSFGTGAPFCSCVMSIFSADPVDFDFIRTLNGKPFPLRLAGTVVRHGASARGGPLTNFVVDDARGTFPRRPRARRRVAVHRQR